MKHETWGCDMVADGNEWRPATKEESKLARTVLKPFIQDMDNSLIFDHKMLTSISRFLK